MGWHDLEESKIFIEFTRYDRDVYIKGRDRVKGKLGQVKFAFSIVDIGELKTDASSRWMGKLYSSNVVGYVDFVDIKEKYFNNRFILSKQDKGYHAGPVYCYHKRIELKTHLSRQFSCYSNAGLTLEQEEELFGKLERLPEKWKKILG